MKEGIVQFQLKQGEWIHLDYQNSNSLLWLEQESKLDPVVISALQRKDPRPRTLIQNGGIMLTLRGVNLNPGAEPDDMISLRIWIDRKRIITSNHRPSQSISDVEELIKKGRVALSPFDILLHISRFMVSYIDDAIDDYEETLLDLETDIIEKQGKAERTDLLALRKELITVRRHLTPQREAFAKLIVDPVNWVNSAQTIQLREINDHLIRILENLDALRERAIITHEEMVSQVSDQLNNRLFRLSIISAIFLPLSFLTGLLGINVGGIPGSEYSGAFLNFIIILIIVFGFQILFLRWKKWL